MKMQIVYKKISEISPYKRNPRKNDKAVDAVAKSIEEFGFKVPIVIDKNNEIVSGHTRVKASIKLGLKEVPCIIADDLTEEQIKAFRIADNSAGAIVDLAYEKKDNPKVAVEVLVGHNDCNIIIESSEIFGYREIKEIVDRIVGNVYLNLKSFKQDSHLARNQSDEIKCGDNGIFKGVPLTDEEKELSKIARDIYSLNQSDGKYILNDKDLIICQSNCESDKLFNYLKSKYKDSYNIKVNPLGDWTGGINVDSGATNRKLGSDMAQSVTGGGIHGKDLSKADVSVNIYAFLKAQETGKPVELFCAIGDYEVDGKHYSEIVEVARKYINDLGGFEKFAEWGLF